MFRYFSLITLSLISSVLFAQKTGQDSILQLEESVVTGYISNQPLLEAPTSVGIVNSAQLREQADQTFLPALNAIPGVRMEERSPGSYRLSLRGSLLRSPWGVRNVKVYMDEFPLTDAGGNTYFNLIDTRSINRIEVLKGPDGSLFGANSGGVVLMDPFSRQNSSGAELGLTGGSYGLFHQNAAVHSIGEKSRFGISQAYLTSEGYRDHSAMRRHYVQLTERWNYHGSNQLKVFAFFADQHYETPGGLNESQFSEDPRQARQPAGPNPGAEEQQAGIFNKTFFGGVSHEAFLGDYLRHVASVFGSSTDFQNPFITNFEERDELNYGLRTYLEAKGGNGGFDWKWNTGMEWQQSKHEIVNYDNLGVATKGDLQAADEFQTDSHFYFTNFRATFNERFTAEAAVSLNFYNYDFVALDQNTVGGSSDFSPEWMPRVSFSYLLTQELALRASVSRGYSPPTTAEIRPSNIEINTDLEAETGWNYETGIRMSNWNSRFQLDASIYHYRMEEAIVRRVDAAGGEYFTNAGGTNQTGLESMIRYWLIEPQEANFVRGLQLSNSYTYSHFRFREYVQGEEDFSGNELTGVPGHVLVTSLNFRLPEDFGLSVQHNFTDEIPLTDANSVYADSYNLLQAKLKWSADFGDKYALEAYAGVDNMLNEKYSLGNDINAYGGRFYNTAPLRNYYAGLVFSFL